MAVAALQEAARINNMMAQPKLINHEDVAKIVLQEFERLGITNNT